MYLKTTRSLLLFALALFCAPLCYGEDLEAGQVTVSTPVYRPELSTYRPTFGTYEYTVSWEGIPAADVSITVEPDQDNLRVIAKAETYSGIDLFYRLRYHSEGFLSALDLSPQRSVTDDQQNSKIKNVKIDYLDNGDIRAVRSQVGKETKVLQFSPNNFTLEPFSASMIARSLPWQIGQSRDFDTFNGKTRYLITISCIGRETMEVNDEEKPVLVFSPKVLNLTNPAANSKLRDAKIYITDDSERRLLSIVSEVFVGSVYTELNKFTPLNGVGTGVQFAIKEGSSHSG